MAKQSKPSKPKATPKPEATPVTVKWLDEPQDHDYPAAACYLSLIAGPTAVSRAVNALHESPTVTFTAKDLLRAAGLPLLPADDPDVAKELDRVRAGTAKAVTLRRKRPPGGHCRAKAFLKMDPAPAPRRPVGGCGSGRRRSGPVAGPTASRSFPGTSGRRRVSG